MTNPSKFLFNVDFSEPEEPEEVAPVEPEIPMIPVAQHEELLKKARAQAFEEGRVKALQDLQTKQETLLTAEVNHLAGAVSRVLETLDPSAVGALWFQPGSFDAALVAEARRRFPVVIAGPCIMVEAR